RGTRARAPARTLPGHGLHGPGRLRTVAGRRQRALYIKAQLVAEAAQQAHPARPVPAGRSGEYRPDPGKPGSGLVQHGAALASRTASGPVRMAQGAEARRAGHVFLPGTRVAVRAAPGPG